MGGTAGFFQKTLDFPVLSRYTISRVQRQQAAQAIIPAENAATTERISLCCFRVLEREDGFFVASASKELDSISTEVNSKMPNAKVLSEKQAIVAELTEKLKAASSGVLVDYKGITVAEDTALRAECRKNELDYAVVKNTLVRFAINNVGLEEMDSVLNGTTSLALSNGDPIAPMRVINKFAKQFNGEKFTIKAGFMDGRVLSMDEIKALAELPSKEVLQAQVLGTMLAPITSLAIVIKAICEQKGGSVEPAEAPAEAAAE